MKTSIILMAAFTLSALAQEATTKAPAPKAPKVEKAANKPKKKPNKVISEQERLAGLNSLAAEVQKQETAEIRAEIARVKLEKELLTEELALAVAKTNAENKDKIAAYQAEHDKLSREMTLAKLKADKLSSELKSLQAQTSLKTTALLAEITEIETAEKRDDYAQAKPIYLDNPLRKDGTLVVSDRRIAFNGPVTSKLADHVTERINYFNNKNEGKPIFIVIDDSPGGSVMAGYRILKSMEGSQSPVYVVVKSFAASMAATITTLAEKSFVYPNAIILHHQISQTMFASLNLTEQKENYEDLKKWWVRLADPIAAKMGITSDEFIEQMYKNTVSGDWSEFGDNAVKLKWADHVITTVHETSLTKNPDSDDKSASPSRKAEIQNGLTSAIDDNGNHYMILPRRNPRDVYMIHNPDRYYRFK